MAYPEYYDILKVKPTASMEEIKQSYRSLAKKLHPDLNKDNPKAEEQLKKVNEAYGVLKDFAKRAEYDYMGKQEQEISSSPEKTAQAQSQAYTPTENTAPKKKKYTAYFFINKAILLAILVAYGWVFYINIDKEQPYNVFKTLNNTADYLIKEVSEKTHEGINWGKKCYKSSFLPKKLTFYLVKSGKINTIKKYPYLLDMEALDSSNNMYSVLMSAPNAEMTEYLLSLSPDVSYKADDGATALLTAIKRGDAESVRLLLQAGALIEDLPSKKWGEYTDNTDVWNLLSRYAVMQRKQTEKPKMWGKHQATDVKTKSP